MGVSGLFLHILKLFASRQRPLNSIFSINIVPFRELQQREFIGLRGKAKENVLYIYCAATAFK